MSVTMDGIYVDGQKAKFRPEDILEGDASAYTEEIGESVTAWLDENVTSGETLVVDNTLTISGAAADAKVTGDEIGALKEGFEDATQLVNNKNFANPYDPDYIEGSYLDVDGVEHVTVYYNCTGYIPVSEGDRIVASYSNNGARTACRIRFITAYDNTKTVVSASGSSADAYYYDVPSGVAYVRCSISTTYWTELQVLKGGVRTDYVAPNQKLSPNYISPEQITYENLKDYVVTDGFNIVPAGESGSGVWYASGTTMAYLAASGSYVNFRFYVIPVESGCTYTFSGAARWAVSVDDAGTVITNLPNASYYSINVGENATRLFITYDITVHPNGLAVCKGDITTDKTMYTAKWLQPNFAERSISGLSVASRVYCSIPNAIYMNTTESIKIYLDNILAQNDSYFWCNSATGLTTYMTDAYLQITCATAGTYTLQWAVYDSNLQKINEGTVSVVVSSLSGLSSAKALIVGDSFVAYDTLAQLMIDEWADQGATLTLIGTRGTAPALHEGRGGWTAYDYCTYDTLGVYSNPFLYDGEFNFSAYMSANSYSDLDFVFINLGINAIYALNFATYSARVAKEIAAYQAMIDSIHSYDPSIKIFCNLPTPPNTIDGVFSTAYGTAQMLWMYANNIKHYAKDMIDNLSGANVYIVDTNCVVDTNADISDGVHPTAGGFGILARAMSNAVAGSQ